MRDYKVGDTIYIKDTVVDIDPEDTLSAYKCVINGWVRNKSIIDELPTAEPVKVVISADVAAELTMNRNSGWNFYGYLDAVREDASTWPATYAFAFEDPDNMFILAKAWFEGYTIKDKLYNIILGKNVVEVSDGYTETDTDVAGLYHDKQGIHLDDDVFDTELTNLEYRFTQKQIDEYNDDFWIKGIDLNDYKVEVKD